MKAEIITVTVVFLVLAMVYLASPVHSQSQETGFGSAVVIQLSHLYDASASLPISFQTLNNSNLSHYYNATVTQLFGIFSLASYPTNTTALTVAPPLEYATTTSTTTTATAATATNSSGFDLTIPLLIVLLLAVSSFAFYWFVYRKWKKGNEEVELKHLFSEGK